MAFANTRENEAVSLVVVEKGPQVCAPTSKEMIREPRRVCGGDAKEVLYEKQEFEMPEYADGMEAPARRMRFSD